MEDGEEHDHVAMMATPTEECPAITIEEAAATEYSDDNPAPAFVIDNLPGSSSSTPEPKRRCESGSMTPNRCDSMSDISQCSSNRPISLCVKYADSEDNLLAIEADLEALEQESTFDKLQRQFDNNQLSDMLDMEQEQRRKSMSALPTQKKRHYITMGNETPAGKTTIK